jgi:hypothetical protein
LDEEEGQVALGLDQVLGVHRPQQLVGLDLDVESVDQSLEEGRPFELVVERR